MQLLAPIIEFLKNKAINSMKAKDIYMNKSSAINDLSSVSNQIITFSPSFKLYIIVNTATSIIRNMDNNIFRNVPKSLEYSVNYE